MVIKYFQFEDTEFWDISMIGQPTPRAVFSFFTKDIFHRKDNIEIKLYFSQMTLFSFLRNPWGVQSQNLTPKEVLFCSVVIDLA